MSKTAIVLITVLISCFSYGVADIYCDQIPGKDIKITVSQIINKYIQSCGGASIKEIKSEERVGTLIRGTAGKVPFKIISESSGKWFYNQVFSFGDQVSYGFDGKEGWIQDTGSVTSMSQEELLDINLLLNINLPLKINNYFPYMKIKEVSQKNGINYAILVARTDNEIIRELVFDLDKGYLIRAGDLYFEDYRDIGIIKRPYKVFIGDDLGETNLRLKMEISAITHNIEIDNSIFIRPICPLPYRESILYKPYKQISVPATIMDECTGVYQNPDKPELTYTLSRQGDHLMIQFPGSPFRIEIMAETPLDYFLKYPRAEFHFVRNNEGKIEYMEIGYDQRVKTKKIQNEQEKLK